MSPTVLKPVDIQIMIGKCSFCLFIFRNDYSMISLETVTYRSSMLPDSISIFSFRKYNCLMNSSVMLFLKYPNDSCGSSSTFNFFRKPNKFCSMTLPPFMKIYGSTMSSKRSSSRSEAVYSISDPLPNSDVTNKNLPVFSLISWMTKPYT